MKKVLLRLSKYAPILMRKLIYIFIAFSFYPSCQQEKDTITSEGLKEISYSAETIVLDTIELNIKRKLLNQFLKTPFDLFNFKRLKKMSNSGIGRKEECFLKPNITGMYYRYFLFSIVQFLLPCLLHSF